jgi:hypothetical protein
MQEEAIFIDLGQGRELTPNPKGDAAEYFLSVNYKPALLQDQCRTPSKIYKMIVFIDDSNIFLTTSFLPSAFLFPFSLLHLLTYNKFLTNMNTGQPFIMRQASPKHLGTFQKDVKPEIWPSWLAFIYNSRHSEGKHANLIIPEKRCVCFCGRARISYPHWPPTTLPEAFDQLDCLLGDHNCHRRYLAHQWSL